jgi:hypothetical protein
MEKKNIGYKILEVVLGILSSFNLFQTYGNVFIIY